MTHPALDLFDDDHLDAPVADAVRRIAIAGFAELWAGRAPRITGLVAADQSTVSAAVDHLRARGRIELTGDGHVRGVHGVCLRKTRHRVEHARGSTQTWCALDAIGIPAAMGIDARAVTHCPTCARVIDLAITGGQPEDPARARLWFPQGRCTDLVADFCSGANLFCSERHLDDWLGGAEAAGMVMTAGDVAELGRECWAEAAAHLASAPPLSQSGHG